MSSLPVLLLCAGFGRRMGELARDTPKPLLPVAGRPILDHLLRRLAELPGIGVVHVVTNHRHAGAFREWADGRRRDGDGPRLLLHDDGVAAPGEQRGAVGDLAWLLERIDPPRAALVAGGDNLFLFSLEPFWRAFRAQRASLVLALRERDRGRLARTAVLTLDAHDRVLELHEGPAAPPSEWSSPALYGLDRDALESVGPYLAAGNPSDGLGRFVAWLATRRPVRAFRTDGRRLHLGTPEAYREACREPAAALYP